MCLQRVKQLYQDANLGQNVKVVKFISIHEGLKTDVPVIKPNITSVTDGWNMQNRDCKMVCVIIIFNSCDNLFVIQIRTKTVVDYNGVSMPPFFEMIFKAASDVSTPLDLTATVIFGDVKKPTNTFTISRVAEILSEGQLYIHVCVSVTLLLCFIKTTSSYCKRNGFYSFSLL